MDPNSSLAKLLSPDETAYDMLRRNRNKFPSNFPRFNCPNIDLLSLLKYRPGILEIEGESGFGKTSLLLSLAAKTAQEGEFVVFVDCDGRLSRERFQAHFVNKISMTRIILLQTYSTKDIMSCIFSCLSNGVNIKLLILDSMVALEEFISNEQFGKGSQFLRIISSLANLHEFVIATSKPTTLEFKTWTQADISTEIFLSRPGVGTVRTGNHFEDTHHFEEFNFNLA